MAPGFWHNRSVFVTGHTGFKGGWIALWLSQLGAKVHGYSLAPPTTPNFYTETQLEKHLQSSVIADIRDLPELVAAMQTARPTVVIHMAAQPLVLESYRTPVETFSTNVIGTVNVLEAARRTTSVKAIVNVTTDKCYENHEWIWSYRENDRLGGHDPYSASKACSEIVTAAFRKSFFAEAEIRIASVRAGNVIGGGDWATGRIIPDFLRAFDTGNTLIVRSPEAVRPWQHVLEPLSGYLLVAERLVADGNDFAEAWNFGPRDTDAKPVSWVLAHLCKKHPQVLWRVDGSSQPSEARLLKLDSTKSQAKLGWERVWDLDVALQKTLEWHSAWREGHDMSVFTKGQIKCFTNKSLVKKLT